MFLAASLGPYRTTDWKSRLYIEPSLFIYYARNVKNKPSSIKLVICSWACQKFKRIFKHSDDRNQNNISTEPRKLPCRFWCRFRRYNKWCLLIQANWDCWTELLNWITPRSYRNKICNTIYILFNSFKNKPHKNMFINLFWFD